MPDPHRWFDPGHVADWDANSGRNNPTRAEQLDIVADLAVAAWRPGSVVVDFACGTGHALEALCTRHQELRAVAVDYSPQVLAAAEARLAAWRDRVTFVQADLTNLAAAELPAEDYAVAISMQSFHHFQDDEKRRQVAAMHDRLAPGGVLVVQDRFEVPGPGLYDLYQALWRRQERVAGIEVSDEAVPDPEATLKPDDEKAAALPWFLDMLRDCGFEAACLHLHGTRGIVVGRKPATAA